MKIPSVVKVGGHWLWIKAVPYANIKGYGSYNRSEGRIKVANDVSKSQQAATLLHELLHACWAEASIGGKDKEEERVIRALEPFLFQVLVDNPKVVKFIQEAK